MKNIKDIIIILTINLILISFFTLVADHENKLFLDATYKHIENYTTF